MGDWDSNLFYPFISCFVVVNGFKTEYDLDDDEYINSSGGGYSGFEILSCSAPRFESGSADGSGWAGLERDLYNPRYSLMFKEGLIYDQETCESYEGASWVEDKIFSFGVLVLIHVQEQ